MTRIEWSDVALGDLLAIRDYIARDSAVYARRFAERVLDAVDRLGTFPESGRLVPEAGRQDVRELIFQGYRIIYRIEAEGQAVFVLAVIHGKRNIARESPQPWEID